MNLDKLQALLDACSKIGYSTNDVYNRIALGKVSAELLAVVRAAILDSRRNTQVDDALQALDAKLSGVLGD